MNAPWWLAKVSAAWKRKQLARGLRGPQFGTEAAMEDFCRCNATRKAMKHVRDQWVVAGIGKD